MTSEKQAQANRRNALKSTGPKIPEGKAAVRLNAKNTAYARAGIFAWELYGELAERAQQEAHTYEWSVLDALGSPEQITDQQKHQKALSRAQEMKAKQDAETATLGRTFIRDADKANAFSKLSRYETAIWRSLYKALDELHRLQAARHNEGYVLPPIVLDMDVSGVSEEGV